MRYKQVLFCLYCYWGKAECSGESLELAVHLLDVQLTQTCVGKVAFTFSQPALTFTDAVACILGCRNAIVLSPHVRAAKCSIEAARIVREAAERAGAPKGLVQWIDKPSLVLATALMKDPKINLILATGKPVADPTCCLVGLSLLFLHDM